MVMSMPMPMPMVVPIPSVVLGRSSRKSLLVKGVLRGALAARLEGQFTLDGKPLSANASLGLIAMAAVAGQAAEAVEV